MLERGPPSRYKGVRPDRSFPIATKTASRRAQTGASAKGGRRLTSLDTLRGVALVAVLAGLAVADISRLPDLFHPSPWHGFRPADLVAPVLLVISGGALAVSRMRHRDPRAAALRLARRVVLLLGVVVGLELLAGTPPEALSVELVLSSPLAQLAAAWVVVWLVAELPRPAQAAVAGVLLAANWIGLSRLAPTEPHLFVALPTVVVTVLAGFWVGDWLRSRPDGPATGVALALTGIYVGATGVVGAQVLPLNRTLMTTTFVLFGVGAAAVLLALAYVLVTVLPGRRLVSRLTVLGRHAFPAYVATAAVTAWLGAGEAGSAWERLVDGFGATFGAELGALLLAAAVVTAAVVLVGVLDRRGLHLRA